MSTAARACESVQTHDGTDTQGPPDAFVAHPAWFGWVAFV